MHRTALKLGLGFVFLLALVWGLTAGRAAGAPPAALPPAGCLPGSTGTAPCASPTATQCPPAAWQLVPSPNRPGSHNELHAVAGVAPDDRWAVGNTGAASLILHWNGAAWTIIPHPSPAPGFDDLLAVSARTSSDVWAVGHYNSGGRRLTLVEHWDGSVWTIVPSPNPPTGDTPLTGVAALAPNDVWAVGIRQAGLPGSQTLTEHWDGTAWTIVPSPNMGDSYNDLAAVVALAANDVWAVGGYYIGPNQFTLTEHWDGSAWSVVPSPNPSPNVGGNVFNAVGALSASDIWAVGSYNTGPYLDSTLVEHWDGTHWSIVPSPNDPDPAHRFNELGGVVALAPQNVWVIGDSRPDGTPANERPLLLHWDGAGWQVSYGAALPGATDSRLNGISGATPDELWAVGTRGDSAGYTTLTERFTSPCPPPPATATATPLPPTPTSTPVPPTATPSCAPGWTRVPSPNLPGANRLYDVNAVAANDVWAVGDAGAQGLIAHWNGVQWSLVPHPEPGLSANSFDTVAARTANDVWAVGYYSNGGRKLTLVEHWDGSAWTVVPSPNPPSGDTKLSGVAPLSADDVWAVGIREEGTPSSQTLALHWDGTAWQIVPTQNLGTGWNSFSSVTAVAANDVWAVGSYYIGTYQYTLVERWDGTSWQVVSSPNPAPGLGGNVLNAVGAGGATDVWSPGDYNTGPYLDSTLVEHWDGTAWQIVPSPNDPAPGYHFDALAAVSALSAQDVWVAGWSAPDGQEQNRRPFLLHWDGAAWQTSYGASIPGLSDGVIFGMGGTSAADRWAVGQANTGAGLQTLIEHYTGPCQTPSPTATAVPPTATSTPTAPPKPTNTPPPKATSTPVPPTQTPTPHATCPPGTPTRVPTPAFTPAPGCAPTPAPGTLTALIIDHPTTTEARFTNYSPTCSYPIGLAVYRKFDANIETQELYDYRLAVIPPNSTLTLVVNNPTCAFQGDAFYGRLIESFAGGARYGERRLDDTDGNGANYCTVHCVPAVVVPSK